MRRPDAKVGLLRSRCARSRNEELRDFIDAMSTGFLERPDAEKR
jgi:hypothetical protein